VGPWRFFQEEPIQLDFAKRLAPHDRVDVQVEPTPVTN
jgi:hypothetical protein